MHADGRLSKLMYSRPLLEDVIKNLESGSHGQCAVGNAPELTNTPDTRILKIAVTSPDPNQAADIANELVKQACIYLPQNLWKPRSLTW